MNVLVFISALVAFIPAILAAAVPRDTSQVGIWGKPTDIPVLYCYMDGDCMAVRNLWQTCQVDQFKDPSAPIGNPEARNELVASCLCAAPWYANSTDGCLSCISLASQNFLVADVQTANSQKVCNKTMTLSQFENYSFQFGGFLQFPLILPSLWIVGTNVTHPDQILIE